MVRCLASPAPQIPWCRPPPEYQPQDPGALMSAFDQYMLLSLLITIAAMVGVAIAVFLSAIWPTDHETDAAEAMWSTLETELRRMREADRAH